MFSEQVFGRAEASFVLANISTFVVVLTPLIALFVLLKVPEVPTFNAPPVSLKDACHADVSEQAVLPAVDDRAAHRRR